MGIVATAETDEIRINGKSAVEYAVLFKSALAACDDHRVLDLLGDLGHDDQIAIWNHLSSSERALMKKVIAR